jgi:steroid delta-isomerase-like uncharacterized protein
MAKSNLRHSLRSATPQEVYMRRVSAIVSIAVLVAQMGAVQKTMPIADSWCAAWNSHDPEKVISIFTPDVLFEDVTFGATSHGSPELRKFAASIFDAVPDAKFELVDASADRKCGRIEWVFSGTDHGLYKTGKSFSVRGVSVIDLRQGRISRELDYYDAATIMRQVGLLASPKTDSEK